MDWSVPHSFDHFAVLLCTVHTFCTVLPNYNGLDCSAQFRPFCRALWAYPSYLNQNGMRRSSRKYYYYRRPIIDQHAWSKTHQRPQHASSETDMPDQRPIRDLDILHQRPTCLIRDPLETNMPDRRPIGDLNMLNWRPTCLKGDPLETSTCPIGDPLETSTCPIGDQHTCLIVDTLETDMPNQKPHQRPTCQIRLKIKGKRI